jgi:predicted DNA-binding protein
MKSGEMANPFLGVRIPPDLNEAIMARMHQTGQSKSEIVIEALRVYLGMAPEHIRLDNVEERLAALELELGLLHRHQHLDSHPSAEHHHPVVDPQHLGHQQTENSEDS